MRVPVWLTLGIAAIIIAFGAYRIYLASRKRPADEGASARGGLAGGLRRMKPRTHLLVGIIYVLLGAALIGTSFGWNPFGRSIGPATAKPGKAQAPTTIRVPIDHLPPPKKK